MAVRTGAQTTASGFDIGIFLLAKPDVNACV
jgi:hypothetical protein